MSFISQIIARFTPATAPTPAPIPRPRPAPQKKDPKPARSDAIPPNLIAAIAGLVDHKPDACPNTRRYSPEGFDAPIWSLKDCERAPLRRVTKGQGSRAGHVLLIDRRKAWQKKLGSFAIDRTGCIVTERRA